MYFGFDNIHTRIEHERWEYKVCGPGQNRSYSDFISTEMAREKKIPKNKKPNETKRKININNKKVGTSISSTSAHTQRLYMWTTKRFYYLSVMWSKCCDSFSFAQRTHISVGACAMCVHVPEPVRVCVSFSLEERCICGESMIATAFLHLMLFNTIFITCHAFTVLLCLCSIYRRR